MSAHPEATLAPEKLSPALTTSLGIAHVDKSNRGNFQDLPPAQQEQYREDHPEGYINTTYKLKRGAMMVTGGRETQADGDIAYVGGEATAERINDAKLDGAYADEAVEHMRMAIYGADDAIHEQKKPHGGPNGHEGLAGLAIVRVFRDVDGNQHAIFYNSGPGIIGRIRASEEGIEPISVGSRDSSLDGHAGHTERTLDDPNIFGVLDDVQPDDRFIILNEHAADALHNAEKTEAGMDAIEKALLRIADADKAAYAVAKAISKYGDKNPANRLPIGDANITIVDVEKQRSWRKLAWLGRIPTMAIVAMQARGSERRAKHRERYLDNPTWSRRALVALDTIVDSGAAVAGLYAISKLGGIGLGIEHQAHDEIGNLLHHVTGNGGHGGHGSTPAVPGNIDHTPAHGPSTPGTTDPFSNLHSSNHAAGTAAHAAEAGAPAIHLAVAPEAGAGNIDINHLDPNHLPDGVKLTPDEVKWLEAHQDGGALGAYEAHSGADGLGNHGTIWRQAMENLVHAGYDPKEMSLDEKKAYIQHVLDLNHLTWEQAAGEDDKFAPVMPSNGDIFTTMTHITAGHEGGPLMPAADSDFGRHLAQIQHTAQTQIGGNAGIGSATQPHGAGTGTVPGAPATPTPAPSAPTHTPGSTGTTDSPWADNKTTQPGHGATPAPQPDITHSAEPNSNAAAHNTSGNTHHSGASLPLEVAATAATALVGAAGVVTLAEQRHQRWLQSETGQRHNRRVQSEIERVGREAAQANSYRTPDNPNDPLDINDDFDEDDSDW